MWLMEEHASLMNDALLRRETMVFFAKCSIRYSGRAESYVEEGERVFLIKSDGTLIVHQPTGNAPLNYMKPDTSHSFFVENGVLKLKSSNISMKEFLDASISKVIFFNSEKLNDGQTIVVQGTEEDMSEMIMQKPELIEEGFKPVSREEQTKYGFVDVLGVDKNDVLTVVECKRYCADLSSVTQLRRYVEKIMVTKGIANVRGILAAPKITENALKMLQDWSFSFVSVNPPKYLENFNKKQAKLDFF